jgi:hypothetical protein
VRRGRNPAQSYRGAALVASARQRHRRHQDTKTMTITGSLAAQCPLRARHSLPCDARVSSDRTRPPPGRGERPRDGQNILHPRGCKSARVRHRGTQGGQTEFREHGAENLGPGQLLRAGRGGSETSDCTERGRGVYSPARRVEYLSLPSQTFPVRRAAASMFKPFHTASLAAALIAIAVWERAADATSLCAACRNGTPPCPSGLTCEEGVCKRLDLDLGQPCADPACERCRAGLICRPFPGRGTLCVSPPPPVGCGGSCDAVVRCQGGGLTCENGTCKRLDVPPGGSCSIPNMCEVCAAGLACVDGECVASSPCQR